MLRPRRPLAALVLAALVLAAGATDEEMRPHDRHGNPTWAGPRPTVPRAGHASAPWATSYAASRERCALQGAVVFGGRQQTGAGGDLRLVNTLAVYVRKTACGPAGWRGLLAGGPVAPAAREGHSMHFQGVTAGRVPNDGTPHKYIVFGGHGGRGQRSFFNDVFQLTLRPVRGNDDYRSLSRGGAGATARLGARWDKLWPEGAASRGQAAPSPRSQHASAAVGPLLVVHGGLTAQGVTDDVWVFDTRTHRWTGVRPMNDHVPRPRAGHFGGAISVGGRAYVAFFGGHGREGVSGDAYLLHTGCTAGRGAPWRCGTPPAGGRDDAWSWVDVEAAGGPPGGGRTAGAAWVDEASPDTLQMIGGYSRGGFSRAELLRLRCTGLKPSHETRVQLGATHEHHNRAASCAWSADAARGRRAGQRRLHGAVPLPGGRALAVAGISAPFERAYPAAGGAATYYRSDGVEF